MNLETIEEEILTNGNRKIVIGIRCYGELKFKLTEEANNLGISLSEHCENSLLNKNTFQIEKENALKELIILEKKITELKKIGDKNSSQYQTEIEKLITENMELQKGKSMMNDQLSIFSDKRLLDLFALIKGKKDTIEMSDGQKLLVTFNHPKDVLKALLYSFNLKKP